MKATKLIFKTFLSSAFKAGLLSSLIIAQVHFAYAQTASILPPAKTTFLDQNGKPLTGGTVKFYIPGTTTPKTTWQDSGETVPNTNPVVLDSAGRGIILGDGSYRQQVYDKKGNLIWDQQTSSTGSGGGGSTPTVGDGNPVGTIKLWPGFIAPNQYVFSYGQELARASFPELLSAITSQQNVSCTSASATLTGLNDTSQIPVGAPIESICLSAGTTVVSTTISTIVVSAAAIISTNTTARIFPYGDGDGSSTFNTPDYRGNVPVGRCNMGNSTCSNLTTAYYGVSPSALNAKGGAQNTTLARTDLPNVAPTFTGDSSTTFVLNATHNQVSWTTTGTTVGDTVSNGSTSSVSGGNIVFPVSGSITPKGTVQSLNGGVAQTSIARIQPSATTNYIIKTTPDSNPNSFFGVAQIGGMTGIITCGFGITCAGNNISAVSSVVPAPTPTTLGGVFQSSAPANQFANGVDSSGNILYAQPSFSNISGIATLAAGGTNANLTASNGGIFWSNATQGQILAGTATANLPLLSGATATPSWATVKYLASATSGGIPYFSSTTQMTSSAAMTANAFIIGGGAGVSPTSVALTGLVLGNGASSPTAYGGVTCTNQFLRALSAAGASTCNTVSLTADVTATLPIANGGTSQTTALAARGSSGLNIDGATSTGDANYTILSTDRMVYHTALSAARTDTLPAANSVNAGQVFTINDFAGVVTVSHTVTLQRAGADTINGVTSAVALNSQYGAGIFWSDGVSRWTFFPASTGGGSGTVTQVNCGYSPGLTITTSGDCTNRPVVNIANRFGSLDVWQRGAGNSSSIAVPASTTTGQYTADGCYLLTNANEASVVSSQPGIANGSYRSAKVLRNSGQTGTTAMKFGCPLDSSELSLMTGYNVALSFSAKEGANQSFSHSLSWALYCGTGSPTKRLVSGFTGETTVVSGTATLSTSTARYQGTSSAVVPANCAQAEIQFSITPSGTAGADDSFYADDIQLEVVNASTSVASPFIPLAFGNQLVLAQGYFAKTFSYSTAPGQNLGNVGALQVSTEASSTFGGTWKFPQTMRSVPTMTTYSPCALTANWCDINNGSVSRTIGAVTPGDASSTVTGSSGIVNGLNLIHLTADAGL